MQRSRGPLPDFKASVVHVQWVWKESRTTFMPPRLGVSGLSINTFLPLMRAVLGSCLHSPEALGCEHLYVKGKR